MLALLLLQTGLGLFAADVDGLHEGAAIVPGKLRSGARGVGACTRSWSTSCWASSDCTSRRSCFHLVHKRENLTGAMVTGRGPVPAGFREPRIAGDGRAVLVLAVAAAVVLGGIELARIAF